MSSFRDKLLNRSLELGMSVVQRALGHPTVGPLVMRSLTQGMQLKDHLDQARAHILERMQVATQQEQIQLQEQVETLERKLERLERRLRQLNAEARAAEAAAVAAAAQFPVVANAAADTTNAAKDPAAVNHPGELPTTASTKEQGETNPTLDTSADQS